LNNEEQERQPEVLAEEWGARLTSVRESRSISIEQAAADLNLPTEYLRCIEAGRLEGLPSMVFARGYIRAYLKMLGIDGIDARVAEYVAIHGEGSSNGAIRPVSRVRQQVKMGDPLMKLFTWVFVLAILGVSIWWWQTQYGGFDATSAPEGEGIESASSATDAGDVVMLENGTATLALPTLDDSPVDEGLSNKAAVDEEQAELTEEERKALQDAIDATPKSAEAGAALNGSSQVLDVNADITISADFVAECWVSIKDGDGQKLFNNLRGKGQSVNVTGKPPLSILIGAADAVGSFRYNGATFDLAPFSNKNVVRLNLPVSE
jgi:cytoskeleton protein RodZ